MTVDTGLDTTWASRVRGALLLSAWADAIGASETTRRFVCEHGQLPTGLRWSQLRTRVRSVEVLAEHLSRHDGRVEPAELGRALLRDGSQARPRSDPWPGGGWSRVPQSRSWTGGTSATSRGTRHPFNVVSTVPVGLLPGVGLDVIARRARRAAAISQAHPLALDLAAVQAVTVAAVIRSSATPVNAEDLMGHAVAESWNPGLHAALRLAEGLVRWEAHEQQMALQLNRYPWPVAAISVGLAAFLRHPADPLAAILLALRVGADPAVAAAMAAALGGARHGGQALPWPLEAPARLERAADALAALARPGAPRGG